MHIDVPVPDDDDDAMEDIATLIMSLGYNGVERTDVMEVFMPGRLAPFCQLVGLVHGGCFDLRAGWDLSDKHQQTKCLEMINYYEPVLVVGCPMCAPFSVLQYLNPVTEQRERDYEIGYIHLSFVCDIYGIQVARGDVFLHEHPWTATSWSVDVIEELLKTPGVEVRRGDQCAFGLVVPDARGDRLAKKPTGWMSNCPEILDEICITCTNDTGIGEYHQHSTFVGRDMRAAERYTPQLLQAILRGLKRYIQRRPDLTIGALDCGPHVDDEELGLRDFVGQWRDTVKDEFYDDLTGLPMDPDLVRAGRRVEMDFMAKLGDRGVWEYSTTDECYQETGRKPLGVRWVDTDKGDKDRPDYRSRLVVQETRSQSTIEPGDVGAVFAATPPLECLRLVCSEVMSSDPAEKKCLRFLDISRAHPHCEIKRVVYIRLPEEDPRSTEEGICGKLLMALYGTRDAGQNFELTTAQVLKQGGCEQSAFSPCVYNHEEKRLGLFHHGDDFVISGARDESAWVTDQLSTKFIVKDRGVLGPEPQDLKEITCLNRTIRWRDRWASGGEAIEYEADPRHVQILLPQLNLDGENTKPLGSPGVKVSITPELERELDEGAAAEYRSPCMRLGYLALDRPEVQFAAKECARGMAKPTVRHLQMLKRCARFLKGLPRAVWRFGRQRKSKYIDVYSDTDWAGCPVSRRSTSAVVVKYGQHTIVTASTTQIPISLSSGEAEFYGLVRAASRAIGMKELSAGFGHEVNIRLWADSSAAIGIAQRRGCGRVRHQETPTLWIQKALHDGRFTLNKVPGKLNPADLGTKHLDAATMKNIVDKLGINFYNEPLRGALQARV